MDGSDEFLTELPSMPDLESFKMAEFNIEGLPELPSFNMNSNFNLGGVGDSGNGALDDFGAISAENSGSGEETLSERSLAEFHETGGGEVESEEDDGHRRDVESTEESAFSSQERENALLLDKNEKLHALLSRKKKDAFDELRKPKESDSSQSQETEMKARKRAKSSMKRSSESREKKNVEFVLPKKKAIPKKPRYGPDGREITEVEARAHDYFGEKKSPQINFDVYRHRRNQQDIFETPSSDQTRLDLQKLIELKKKRAEILAEMEKVRQNQAKILEEVRSLESTEKNAEALVESLGQRLTKEKKVYEASREILEKLSSAREKQLSLNRSIELKNRILEEKRQELMKRQDDIRRRKERNGAKFRALLLQNAEQ